MKVLKKFLPDILAVLLFVVLSFAYFFPAVQEGRVLYQEDTSAVTGLNKDTHEYQDRTGKISRWTNSVFSGMPTYQIAPGYKSTFLLGKLMDAYHLWLPGYVWCLFVYFLGFYILLRAFDFRQSLAVLGSIIWALSSYFLIIIAAGHFWKVFALAYLPPMIAGVVLAYRGKYLWGFLLTAIFAAFEVKANHVQMTYYYLFIIFFMIIAFLVDAIRNKKMAQFGKATLTCAVAALIGISLNLSNLYQTWNYSKETMRGKSELVKADTGNQTDSGLDRDYITQWSYGIDETWTLLVPNTKGGSSNISLASHEKAMEKADPQYMQIYQQLRSYWGTQPMTSGPVYVGAFVLMLFILGLFIVKGPMKWALLAATILSILLSWGKNFMWFTNLFIDYMPMYSKFRTVSSILVIAEFTIPLLAMLALKKIIEDPDILKKKMKYVYISFGLTGGISLIFALFPRMFFGDFVSPAELQALSGLPSEHISPIISNLNDIRSYIFSTDAWRSFWVIVIGTLLLLAYRTKKVKPIYIISGITVLCLWDMWSVDKRYLNDEMFVEKTVTENPIVETTADKMILKDTDPDYRVLNMSTNTFNENATSYFHKSIGGYHAAKLRRYQELIEAHIAPEMGKLQQSVVQTQGNIAAVKGDTIWPVLNMLNAKYFIFPLQNGETTAIQNPFTLGNAWFVDKIQYVDNANKELDALSTMDVRHEAVADAKFKDILGEAVAQDSSTTVKLTAYEPNELTYEVNSSKGGVLVFSEVYYPEWTATVDGEEVEVGRVNYVLRAINVKPGKHKVVLQFIPKSIDITETIAYVGYGILLLSIIIIIFFLVYKRRNKQSVAEE